MLSLGSVAEEEGPGFGKPDAAIPAEIGPRERILIEVRIARLAGYEKSWGVAAEPCSETLLKCITVRQPECVAYSKGVCVCVIQAVRYVL